MPSIQESIYKLCKSIQPRYIRPEEKSINPAFENLDQGKHCPINNDEHRIFVLTQSLTLNTGIKNSEHNSQLVLKTDPNTHKFINWNDRYGHPSIANEEAIFYAGYVYQRSDSLEVIRLSGRYPQKYSAAQEALLESYLAQKFCEAYGTQKVIFYSFNEALSLSGILSDNREYWDKNKHRIMRREYNEVLQTAINNITIAGSFHAKDWLKIKDNVQLQTAINHTAAINHFSRDLWRHIRGATALQKAINNVAAIDKFSQSHWLTIKDNPKLQTAINHIAATGSFSQDHWLAVKDNSQLQTTINNIAIIGNFSCDNWLTIKDNSRLQTAVNNIAVTGEFSEGDWPHIKNNAHLQVAANAIATIDKLSYKHWHKIRDNKTLQAAVNHIAATGSFYLDDWNKIIDAPQLQTAVNNIAAIESFSRGYWDKIKNKPQLQAAINHISATGHLSRDDWYKIRNSEALQQAVNNIAATGHFLYDDWRKIKSDFLLQQAINTIAATEHFSRDDWCKITTTEQTSIRNKFQEKIISLKELTINKTENRQTAIDSYAVKAFTCFTSKVLDKTNRETFKETLHSVQKECTQILDDSLSRKILKVITNFLSHISLVGMIANAIHKHKTGNWFFFEHTAERQQMKEASKFLLRNGEA